MCRIFGYLNAEVSSNEFRTVAALQRHGGPDGQGLRRRLGCGVGNNRLAVIDPDGGEQPYRLDDRIHVVFNGEIYNHDALRRDLVARGHRFPGRCDGDVLPALFAEYGPAFTDHLDGMYAIAVLDLRDHPRLTLVTDHAGMKPLYWHWNPATRAVHFSSELPALLGFDGVGAEPWEPGLDAYLSGKTPFGEETMVDGVRVLPPASTLTCSAGAAPELRRRPAPAPSGTEDAPGHTPERLRELLDREVGRLTVADVPAAVITSGGLDSSLVTALAAGGADPLHSFTVAYTGRWPADERHFAAEVAERAGTRHHLVELDPVTIPDLVEDVVWHLGQPNADPITVSTWALFEEVSRAGFKVALSGDAADEVFGGYPRMRAATRAAAAGRPWLGAYLDALGVLPAVRRRELYTDDYRALVAGTPSPIADAVRRLSDGPGSVLERVTAFETGVRMPAYHLRRVDHLSMAHAVEVRLPFCQRAVMELGAGLADDERIRGDEVKRTLYGAAAGLLPRSVLERPKQPFTLPITAMLAPGQPLWDYACDTLTGRSLRDAGQIDPTAVASLLAGQRDTPDDTTALTVWALTVYEVWRRQTHRVRLEDDATVAA